MTKSQISLERKAYEAVRKYMYTHWTKNTSYEVTMVYRKITSYGYTWMFCTSKDSYAVVDYFKEVNKFKLRTFEYVDYCFIDA